MFVPIALVLQWGFQVPIVHHCQGIAINFFNGFAISLVLRHLFLCQQAAGSLF